MKPWLKLSIGIAMSLLSIMFIVLWDTVLKDRIDSVEVVVIKPGIVVEKNETVTNDKLLVEKRNKSSLIEGIVHANEVNKVIGKTAKQTLVGNQILSSRQLDMDGLTPNARDGESIRPIPENWIYASPSTLRRTDKIDIYLIPGKDMKGAVEDANISYSGLSPEQEKALLDAEYGDREENKKYENERKEISDKKGVKVNIEKSTLDLAEAEEILKEIKKIKKGKDSAVEVVETKRQDLLSKYNLSEEEWSALVKTGNIPLLSDIPVIYVKDGSGNEIENGENSTESKRLTATGQISDLELILNEEEHRTILDSVNKGFQLYITYN
ncbi:hypothetical protein [Peribacillus loiseleuriae]|uniref:hypothetical protein n=1 Tax=Peribacillus loiseleuriae TaxID=1679170 RepID=UPI003CFCA234